MQQTNRLENFPTSFFTLLLLTQLGRFAELRFFLSWWAYSFPLAAVTIASLLIPALSRLRILMAPVASSR